MDDTIIKRGGMAALVLLMLYSLLFWNSGISNTTGFASYNSSDSSEIGIKLEYKTNTIYDEDNNGIEPIGSAIDFTVENTDFNWAVEESKLCTKWAVYSIDDDIVTTTCHGSSDCCGFIDLVPRREGWKDPLYLTLGEFGSGFSNIVNAQVIYADYNISEETLRADIVYSEWSNLTARFYLDKIPFKNVCVDTCYLKGLNRTSLKLIIEVENSELLIDSISYSIIEGLQKIKPEVYAKDSYGIIKTGYKIFKDGILVNETLINEGFYDIEIEPEGKIVEKITFKNVNYTKPITIGVDKVEREVEIKDIDAKKKFAVDPSAIDFENATLTSTASGDVLYKCRLWDFDKEVCFGEWERVMELVEGEAYNITLAKDDPAFVEGKMNITKIATPGLNITGNASNVQLAAYIPNITIIVNKNETVNLSKYFFNIENAAFTYYKTDNISIFFDNDAAAIVPDKDFIGVGYTYITANKSNNLAASNVFRINVEDVNITSDIVYNFNDGEKVDIGYYMEIDGEKTRANYKNHVKEADKFGFVFDENEIEKELKNKKVKKGFAAAAAQKVFDKKIYYQISSSEDYIQSSHNLYVLERNLTGRKKNIVNQIGQIEERQLKRFLTFEDIFNKEHNIFDTIIQEVNQTVCLNITKASKVKCALFANQTVNLTRKQKRDVGFSLKKQGKNWLAEFSNLFDLDPSFIDDADSNWNSGTFNNMVMQGTGISANLTSSGVNISGSYGSQIFNANSTANWTNMTWAVEAPYGEEIGRSADSNTADIESGLINTSGLVLLMYFNNESNFVENDSLVKDFSVDFNSNNYNQSNGTCTLIANCPTYNYTNKMLGAASSRFDGSDDKLIISTDSTIHPLNIVNTVSVSVWVYLLQYKESDIIQKGLNQTTGGYTLWVEANGNFRWGAQATNSWVSASNDPDLKLWEHIVGTYDGSVLRLYINGVLDNSLSAANAFTNVANLSIGHGYDGYLNGIVDELAVFNRTLSAQEIKNLYKRGALRLNLSARSCDDPSCAGDAYKQLPINCTFGRICDLNLSSAGRYFQYNFTFSSNASSTSIDRVVVNNVSIEYKLVPTPLVNISLNATSVSINGSVYVFGHINLSSGTNVSNQGFNLYLNGTPINVTNPVSTNKTESSSSDWNLGTAVNVTVNANNITLNANSSNQYPNQTGTFTSQVIDTNSLHSNFTLLSWAQEVPYQTEIGRAVGDVSNGVSPFINTSGLVLLMHFNNESSFGENATGGDGDRVYDFSKDVNAERTGAHNNGTTKSGATINKTNYKLGSGAGQFDGSDDQINVPDSPAWTFGNDPFAISLWFNLKATTNTVFIGHDNGAGGQDKWVLYYATGTLYFHLNGAPGNVNPIQYIWTPNTEQWYHMAVTRNGSSYTLYIDGLNTSSGSVTATIPDATADLTIGRAEGIYPLNGKMDEIAIFNRSLSAQETLNLYKRGALRLNLSVRSCDDNGCDTESFSEPLTNASGIKLNKSITPINRYFQYKAVLNTEDVNLTPVLYNVSVNYTTLATDAYGNYNFTFTAPSSAGNYTIKVNTTFDGIDGEGSVNLSVIVPDTIAPVVNISINNSAPKNADIVNITANVTDNSALSWCQFVINQSGAKEFFNKTLSGTSGQCSQNFTISLTRRGVINFSVIVNDTNNNINQSEQIVTVASKEPSITLNAPANNSAVSVSYTILNATVSDADNDTIDVYVWGSNDTSIFNTSILYTTKLNNSQGGINVTYNWTAPVLQPDNSTVLLMHFDNRSEFGETTEGLNNLTYDFSAKRNNGSIYGALWNATGGKFGGAFQFDGTDDYINTSLNQDGVTNYTIEAWVKTGANQGVIVNARGGGSGKSVTLAIGPSCGGTYCSGSSAGVPAVGLDSDSVWRGINAITAVNDSRWHHIVGVFNSTSGVSITPTDFRIYVDGQEESGNIGSVASTTTSPLTGLSGTRLSWHQPWSMTFKGTIDEVAIHNRTLSSAEVLEHYRLKSQRYYWKVNATDNNLSSESQTREFVIDSTPPGVNIINNNATVRLNDRLNISCQAFDTPVIGNITFNISGSSLYYFSFSLTGSSANFSQNITVNLTRGNVINATCWARDNASNMAQNSTLITAANTPPNTPTIIYPTNDLKTNQQIIDINVTFAPDSDNDIINISYYINGRLNQTSLTNTTINASDGTYILNVSLYDGADYSSNATLNFTIDRTRPASNISINNSIPRAGAAVNVTANISDDLGLSWCQFVINQSGAKEFFNKSINGNNNQCSQNFTVTAEGSVINFTVIVNDTLNNINQSELIITAFRNSIPTIKVFNSSGFSADPLEAGNTPIIISFNVTDADGVTEVNASKAIVNLTFGGKESGIFRFNNSCANHTEGASVIINCTVLMRYYDNASSNWAVNISVEDIQGGMGINDSLRFTYNALSSAAIINSLLNFSNVTLSQNNAPSKAPIILNNTGNTNFNLVNITAAQLIGVENESITIQPANFIANLTNSSSGLGASLSNLSIRLVDIFGNNASLPFGMEGASNISIFVFLDVPSSGLSSQEYNATWNLTLLTG